MQNQIRNLVIVALVAALVVITCWNQSRGQVAVPAKAGAVKWEYKIMTCPKLEQSPDSLNKHGADGWELCISQPLGSEGEFYSLILKRPLIGK